MNSKPEVYMDYAATTPVDTRVLNKMLPYFHEDFGNPSSVHRYGQAAEAALEDSRERVAETLNCRADEIIFTSCGTESDNIAIRGAAFSARNNTGKRHILISPVEHHAVSRTALQLANEFGFEVEFLPVDETGMVSPEDLKGCLRKETALVSIVFANNEIGTINPINELAEVCNDKGVSFHTDAVQAAAHLEIDLSEISVDLMSIGAHKFYGPKGVGALFVRKGTQLQPSQTGGAQEYGLRAGTQNIPYIVGLAEALDLVKSEHKQRAAQVLPLRDQIISRVLEETPDAKLTGHPSKRLPNHASFVFQHVDGNMLLMLLDDAGFACSSGSACKTGSPEPSEVLLAIGLDRDWALGSLRVTLGMGSRAEDVDAFLVVLPGLVQKSRI